MPAHNNVPTIAQGIIERISFAIFCPIESAALDVPDICSTAVLFSDMFITTLLYKVFLNQADLNKH